MYETEHDVNHQERYEHLQEIVAPYAHTGKTANTLSLICYFPAIMLVVMGPMASRVSEAYASGSLLAILIADLCIVAVIIAILSPVIYPWTLKFSGIESIVECEKYAPRSENLVRSTLVVLCVYVIAKDIQGAATANSVPYEIATTFMHTGWFIAGISTAYACWACLSQIIFGLLCRSIQKGNRH